MHFLANPIYLRERCYLAHERREKDTGRGEQETANSITSTLCSRAFLIYGKSYPGACSLGSAGLLVVSPHQSGSFTRRT